MDFQQAKQKMKSIIKKADALKPLVGQAQSNAKRYRSNARTNRVAGKVAYLVEKAINRKTETKYIAEDIMGPTLVPSGALTPVNLLRMIPQVSQGVGEHQRIGDKLNALRARSFFSFFLANGINNFNDVTLNLVVLTAKGASTAGAVAALPANNLLKVGNGTNTDPNPAAYTQPQFLTHINNYPINTDQYTLVKWYKKRFAKGSYDINGVPGANATSQIAIQKPMVVIKHAWNPPTLKYNAAGDQLPSNHYPVFIVWCTTNDGGAYSGALQYGLRSEMYFKDD